MSSESPNNNNSGGANGTSNLLKVPNRDTGGGGGVGQQNNGSQLSVNSLGGTSRLNNYNFSVGTSDSEGVLEEGGITMSSNIINKNVHVITTSEIRRDIRTRSMIRMSQLDFLHETDKHHHHAHAHANHLHLDHRPTSHSLNGPTKPSMVVYTLSNMHLVGQVTPLDAAFH